MLTSIGRFRPTHPAVLVAAAIVLVAAGGASARSGPATSGQGNHADAVHRAGLASPDRMIGHPIIVVMKPHRHHHVPIHLFDDRYWASACVAGYPARYDDAMRRVDWRWYGLARCRFADEPVLD